MDNAIAGVPEGVDAASWLRGHYVEVARRMRAAPVVAEPETIPEPTAQIEPPRAVPIPEAQPAPKPPVKPTRHDIARAIIAATAKHFDLTVDELRGQRRRVNEVYARFVAAHLILKKTKMSRTEMAIKLGRRDNTVILHELRRADELLLSDPSFVEDYEAVKAMIDVAP